MHLQTEQVFWECLALSMPAYQTKIDLYGAAKLQCLFSHSVLGVMGVLQIDSYII